MNTAPAEDSRIACECSNGFTEWLSTAPGAVAVSTYQAGKLALIGWDGRQASLLMRQFDKPMGMAQRGNSLALATRHEVTLFADAPLLAPDYLDDASGRGRYDALFLPRVTYHTGDLNVHDLAFGREGLWIVNTRFSCLAGLSQEHCFIPRWKPPFVSELAPEDRCHLNGLALVDGEPKYVTALGTTDQPGQWRDRKANGGVLLEVPSGQTVLEGLSMPHSPRWHAGAVWFLNSGAGELCRYVPGESRHTVVTTLPGYLRGLCIAGNFALVGLSRIRERHIFGGLPVLERFADLQCGVALIELASGREVGRFEFTSGCTELFEVQFVPGPRRPMIVNLQMEAARQAFPAPDFSYWLRPSNQVADLSGAAATTDP